MWCRIVEGSVSDGGPLSNTGNLVIWCHSSSFPARRTSEILRWNRRHVFAERVGLRTGNFSILIQSFCSDICMIGRYAALIIADTRRKVCSTSLSKTWLEVIKFTKTTCKIVYKAFWWRSAECFLLNMPWITRNWIKLGVLILKNILGTLAYENCWRNFWTFSVRQPRKYILPPLNRLHLNTARN